MKVFNVLNREVPLYIKGYGNVRPYNNSNTCKNKTKILNTIKDAILKSGLKSGMTISFHHHLRNGDSVVNQVVDIIADLGIKDLTLCTSSITKAHDSLLPHIESGVITEIQTSGLRGEIAKQQSLNGIIAKPVIFRSHGGRVRAIECGDVKIDVSFIAASACDTMGNMNGIEGKSAFGALAYAKVDAMYAKKVIAITDNLMPFPLKNISIPMTQVDFVVEIESIGNPELISSGATRVTKSPTELLIAKKAANVCIASGLVKQGFSFQAGSGGSSLAVFKYLSDFMTSNGIVASFALGGVTSYLTEQLSKGLISKIFDTQTFDNKAVDSLQNNANHLEMSTDMYANPNNKSSMVDMLDIMILSATEIDTSFNINSLTGSTGRLMGAIGGAQDTASGAKLTVVVAPTMRNRIPIVVDKVTTIVTPGDNIDVLVTERGICVNPKRLELVKKLKASNVTLTDIRTLKKSIEKLTGVPKKTEFTSEIIGVVEYRDGTVLDVIRKVK